MTRWNDEFRYSRCPCRCAPDQSRGVEYVTVDLLAKLGSCLNDTSSSLEENLIDRTLTLSALMVTKPISKLGEMINDHTHLPTHLDGKCTISTDDGSTWPSQLMVWAGQFRIQPYPFGILQQKSPKREYKNTPLLLYENQEGHIFNWGEKTIPGYTKTDPNYEPGSNKELRNTQVQKPYKTSEKNQRTPPTGHKIRSKKRGRWNAHASRRKMNKSEEPTKYRFWNRSIATTEQK
ncbi:hypothetical protein CLF_107981 [Clonorchis sinensis]|uniref:Uncharacterized protein n=1 Tax=Clonorchis sinensis TaxID=79923 RepID=G7YHG1_CLOSI|nr:hypothetical protein CLF_107981 [Clonorchis sinensis]